MTNPTNFNKNFPVTVTKKVAHLYNSGGYHLGYTIDDLTIKMAHSIVSIDAEFALYPIAEISGKYYFAENPDHIIHSDVPYFCFYGEIDELKEFTDNKQLFTAILYLTGKTYEDN